MGLRYLVEPGTQAADICMDIETVHGINAHGQVLGSILLDLAGRDGQYGDIDFSEFSYIRYYFPSIKFRHALRRSLTAYDSYAFHVAGSIHGLQREAPDVAVADYCHFNFFH